MIEAYRRASCVVLPSVYQTMYGDKTNVPELLGQTLLEGMACGTPAICTDVASMPEVVQDQVTGFVGSTQSPGCIARETAVDARSSRRNQRHGAGCPAARSGEIHLARRSAPLPGYL